MARYISQDRKDEVLTAVKNGLTVMHAAEQYEVSSKTIYAWLRKQSDNTETSNLELSRLRRENAELKEIIRALTLEKKRTKKIHIARGYMNVCKNKSKLVKPLWKTPIPSIGACRAALSTNILIHANLLVTKVSEELGTY